MAATTNNNSQPLATRKSKTPPRRAAPRTTQNRKRLPSIIMGEMKNGRTALLIFTAGAPQRQASNKKEDMGKKYLKMPEKYPRC